MKNLDLHILIVEDEIIASAYLYNILEKLGITCIYEASSFYEALDVITQVHIDLIFMDINIDGSIDGINSARILNKEYFIPIIYTTAYADSVTIQGACDTNVFGYLIKPFEKSQVESSLLVALRSINMHDNTQLHNTVNNVIELGNYQKFNLDNSTFYIKNLVVPLTKKESDILSVLCKNLNKNISYESLSTYVWHNKEIAHSTIRDTISRLKKKTPHLKIETVINFGYILKV